MFKVILNSLKCLTKIILFSSFHPPKVLSPINGRVIGTKEIRVGSDKVSITKVVVRVISGLQLSITPDNYVENGYIAETSVTRKLTAQYQEGLLDIDLEFSDGARTPLR